MAIKNKALFLDRDGVINKKIGYVYSTQKFIWLKNVKKAIKYAYDNKYKIIVITNQSGVARGLYSERDIVKLHKTINKELKVSKCKIHDFFYCPYHPKYGNKKYKKKLQEVDKKQKLREKELELTRLKLDREIDEMNNRKKSVDELHNERLRQTNQRIKNQNETIIVDEDNQSTVVPTQEIDEQVKEISTHNYNPPIGW